MFAFYMCHKERDLVPSKMTFPVQIRSLGNENLEAIEV
jgi:hypothetical protein